MSTFIDESGKTITTIGSMNYEYAQKRFGNASASCGSGKRLEIANSGAFTFGLTIDFTIELFVYPTTLTDGGILAIQAGTGTKLEISQVSGALMWRDGTATGKAANWATINTWYHIAFCRYDTVEMLFVGGVLQASISTPSTSSGINYGDGTLIIGDVAATGTTFPGFIDECRIKKNSCLYLNNFTPPTSSFTYP